MDLSIFAFAFCCSKAEPLPCRLSTLPMSGTSDAQIKKFIIQTKVLCLQNVCPGLYFIANCYWMTANNSFSLANYYAKLLLLAAIVFNLPLPLLCIPFCLKMLILQVVYLWVVLLHLKQTPVYVAVPRFIRPSLPVLKCLSRILPYYRGLYL